MILLLSTPHRNKILLNPEIEINSSEKRASLKLLADNI